MKTIFIILILILETTSINAKNKLHTCWVTFVDHKKYPQEKIRYYGATERITAVIVKYNYEKKGYKIKQVGCTEGIW